MQNKPNTNPIKPNLRKAKMNINSLITKDYRKKDDFAVRKNKANSNPISVKPKMNVSSILTKDYENETAFRLEQNKPNQTQFIKYFRDSRLYNISLSDIAIQPGRKLNRESLVCRLVALRDGKGTDVAIGVITDRILSSSGLTLSQWHARIRGSYRICTLRVVVHPLHLGPPFGAG